MPNHRTLPKPCFCRTSKPKPKFRSYTISSALRVEVLTGKGSRLLNSSLIFLVLFPTYLRPESTSIKNVSKQSEMTISCLFFADFLILYFNLEKFTLFNFCFVFWAQN